MHHAAGDGKEWKIPHTKGLREKTYADVSRKNQNPHRAMISFSSDSSLYKRDPLSPSAFHFTDPHSIILQPLFIPTTL